MTDPEIAHLGLGGFFDGIVLHPVLQWHHMLSSWYPITSIENLELNILWDGIFHSATYVFVVIGLFILWRRARGRHLRWSNRALAGSLLVGRRAWPWLVLATGLGLATNPAWRSWCSAWG